MNYPKFFDSKNSFNLLGLEKEFNFLSSLYIKKKLPKVLMLTGAKGIGKSTLINHFLFSIFDEKNYDKKNNLLSKGSDFYLNFKDNIFSNIIYINGSEFKTVKIDDIRVLKTKLFKSSILDKERFIVFDDIDLFNNNSLNALLKIIEEPGDHNHFFLINNNTKELLETIKSRSLEFKIILKENKRLEIIHNLIEIHQIDKFLDPDVVKLTPGNFLKFNHICKEYDILLTGEFIANLTKLLNLYKKHKDYIYIEIVYLVVDFYLRDLKIKKIRNNNKIYEIKDFIFYNLNNFLLYNINQSALLNAINNKLNYE